MSHPDIKLKHLTFAGGRRFQFFQYVDDLWFISFFSSSHINLCVLIVLVSKTYICIFLVLLLFLRQIQFVTLETLSDNFFKMSACLAGEDFECWWQGLEIKSCLTTLQKKKSHCYLINVRFKRWYMEIGLLFFYCLLICEFRIFFPR